MKTNYKLSSIATGRVFEDEGWTLGDSQSTTPTLVRAIYEKKQIEFKDSSFGLFKFADWLPINRMIEGSSAPVTYKSKGLSKCLGLDNLYITFNGYYPAIGANMSSCSFKETEAYTVCARMTDSDKGVLVVASAGNTARAFAKVCSANKIPAVICVPYDNINALWFDAPIDPCVKLFTTESGSDYFDAISLSNEIAKLDGFFAEGGATNVARRDGMSTTFMSAVETIGKIPDYYFQAVGSGTGAIAAWEANQRFIEDGRFGTTKTKLILSQNAPFLLMANSWANKSRELIDYEADIAREHAGIIDAKVLSNRKPPYSVVGGLYDALKDSNGEILTVENSDLRKAADLFKEVEGVDIYSAAAVAVHSLIEYTKQGNLKRDDIVMLNITGGGEKLFMSENKVHKLQPTHNFSINFTPEDVAKEMKRNF